MYPFDIMTRTEQSGIARKRAMILRESQNRPFSNVGPWRPPNEFAELEKGRTKRECHRPIEASVSPEVPFLKASVTKGSVQNGLFIAVGYEGPTSTDSEQGRATLDRHGQRATDVALTPEPTSSCDDAFHFTRQITPSVFMNQKLRLELVERALAVCQEEKLHLQKQLQASLQTAFKLQDVITKQKMVMELEQVAAQKQADQTGQILVERDELKRKLDEAIMAKEEAELTLTLSRDLNVRLFPGTEFANSSLWTESEDEVRRLSHDEQMELLRQKQDENTVEAVISQTVAECVYAGSLLRSEEGRVEAIQSMKFQTEELKRKLVEAIRLREEAVLTVKLSRDLNTRLFPGTGKRCKTDDSFFNLEASLFPRDMLGKSHRQVSDEQVAALRQELDQIRVEAAVHQAVIESVYTGALDASEAKRVEARQLSNSLSKNVEDLRGQIVILQKKLNSCDVTVELPSFRSSSAVLRCEHDPLVRGEVTTPLKVKSDVTPIKFFRSKRVTSKAPPIDPQSGSPWIPRSTTLDFFVAAKREAVLNASLRKSVQELEILGDKVEEHKSILDKVTLLLSYISKSGYSENGSKQLAREICDQLERYDGELK